MDILALSMLIDQDQDFGGISSWNTLKTSAPQILQAIGCPFFSPFIHLKVHFFRLCALLEENPSPEAPGRTVHRQPRRTRPDAQRVAPWRSRSDQGLGKLKRGWKGCASDTYMKYDVNKVPELLHDDIPPFVSINQRVPCWK